MLVVAIMIISFVGAMTTVPVVSTPSAAEEYKAALDARILVNASTWGVLSNLVLNKKAPLGNALSFSDGGLGTPFFYLTILDQARANFSRYNARSSLSMSKYALGMCDMMDPHEPACVKVALAGTLKRLKPRSREGRFANATVGP